MDSRYILDKSSVGARVGIAGADFNCRTGRSVLRDTRVSTMAGRSGAVPVYVHGPVLYKLVQDVESAAEEVKGDRSSEKRDGHCPGARNLEHTERTGVGDQSDTGSTGILRRVSPAHCQPPGGLKHVDVSHTPGQQSELSSGVRAAHEHHVALTERQPLPSSHIPVPRNRKPSGHADKEVMAATVLTSLSTPPLVIYPSSASTEPASRAWKEALSESYSSSTSGNWSWEASDQSGPSTPSPPLSNHDNKNFVMASQSDDVTEDVAESTHFLFDEPIPRKRKNSMKVMFKCLWKNCEKVLSTSLGIQRHIRTVHLGRNSDSDHSDGEEDFYFTEIEVDMDSLSEGLSSLTPTSPTTAGPPPVFPLLLTDVCHSEHVNVSHAPSLLSQSAPSALCHIRTDHAYQGPVTHSGEKRPPAAHTHTTVKSHAVVTAAPKSIPGSRKPRGEAKKCRKVYGMEKRDMWCTACRWKKACQRFTD